MAIEEYRNNPVFGPGIGIDHAQHAIAKRCDSTESSDCSRLRRVGLRKIRARYCFRDPFLGELSPVHDVLSVACHG
jgi:hypothetical protein